MNCPARTKRLILFPILDFLDKRERLIIERIPIPQEYSFILAKDNIHAKLKYGAWTLTDRGKLLLKKLRLQFPNEKGWPE